MGLKGDGSIVAWGDPNYGQCDVPAPNSGFVAVAAGWIHSLGLKAFYGDLNCDGAVNIDDIEPFVLALVNPGAYADAYGSGMILNADCNEDGNIDSLDIDPFVAILTGG